MKRKVLLALSALTVATIAQASDDNIASKIAQCYSATTSGAIKFVAQKSGGGYDLLIKPENKVYQMILAKDAKIHLNVDEGPLITTPSFGFGKAGIVATGNIVDILSKEVTKDIPKNVKEQLKYKYEGKVSFGGELKSKTIFDALNVNDKDVSFKSSKAIAKGNMDIDSCLGKTFVTLDTLEIKPKKEQGLFLLKGLKLSSELTDKPIDNIALFATTNFSADEVTFKAKNRGKTINTKFSFDINGDIKRVDKDYLNLKYSMSAKALDANTIALTKGIKASKFDFEIDNSKIEGMLDLVKLSQEIQKVQDAMYSAKSEVERQKAIIEYTNLTTTKLVPIYNKILIKDKTRVKLNLELDSDKKSFVKADLLYKADPVQDNMQSAMITLAAQNLAVADGIIEIQIDKDTATAINPLAIIGLDMLKVKGFADEKNGIYHLKAELKGGKVIIKGKAYTLQELSKMGM